MLFRSLYLDLTNPASASANFLTQYQVNAEGDWTSLGTVTLNEDDNYVLGNLPFPQDGTTKTKFVRFKFRNAQVGEDFRFTRGSLIFNVEKLYR